MIYNQGDPRAADAMDDAKTGFYGEDGYSDDGYPICPICGSEGANGFYINDCGQCVGCTDCVIEADDPEYPRKGKKQGWADMFLRMRGRI